jgi:lysophospholipase L1-like esterase
MLMHPKLMNTQFSWQTAGLCAVIIAATVLIASPLTLALQAPRPDDLATLPWWTAQINLQAQQNKDRVYSACLFGDSISSGLGQTLGADHVNFGTGGLSTVSLRTQLKILNQAGIGCAQAVIAIGTNDAMYVISNAQFVANLRESIDAVRSMGATKITLIPAFYSTLAASQNPMAAGPLSRVDEINQLIYQVAQEQDIPVASDGLDALYDGNELRDNLTFDGVHLNDDGKIIYRGLLQKLLP